MGSENPRQIERKQATTSYLLGRLLRQRPWMSASIILVVSVGLSSLLGLSRDWAWGIICWGLLIILVVSGIQKERAEKSSPDYLPRKSMWRGWWGACTAVAILICGLTGQDIFQSQRDQRQRRESAEASARLLQWHEQQNLHEQAKQLAATEGYWKVAVSDLHTLRFPVPNDEDQSAPDFYISLSHDLNEAIERAELNHEKNGDFVDEDLKNMAVRHFQIDKEVLTFAQKVIGIAKSRGLPTNQKSAAESIGEGQRLMERLASDEVSPDQVADEWGLPPEMIEQAIRLEYLRNQQHEEIEAMQEQLRDKLPNGRFLLPSR